MKVLLDTHIVLWAIMDSPLLSAEARHFIQENSESCFFSAASVWEVAIKNAIPGKGIGIGAREFWLEARSAGFLEMPVTSIDTMEVESMPHHHWDPFDRILVAQAMVEGCILVTHDDNIAKYGSFVRRV